jgi:hypothetical protein
VDDRADFAVDDDAARFCERAEVLVVPTDDRDPALERACEAAAQLAAVHDLRLVLYDRSGERWTDTPHPKGPVEAAELGDDRPHLRRRLDELRAAGVPATAWLATVPALTAMTDVLQEIAVDGMVVPAQLDRPKMMDRLQVGEGPAEMVERVAALQTDRPAPGVLVVDDDRHVRLMTTDDLSINEGRTSP